MADRVDGPCWQRSAATTGRSVSGTRMRAAWPGRATRGSRSSNFRWWDIGHDGFQQDGVVDLQAERTPYQLERGGIYRLNANDVIRKSLLAFSEAHSDIATHKVAWAAVSAAGLEAARLLDLKGIRGLETFGDSGIIEAGATAERLIVT